MIEPVSTRLGLDDEVAVGAECTHGEDVGGAVALLCADEAAWIQGKVIAVDGGRQLVNTGGEVR